MYCKIKKIPYFSKYFSTVSLTIVTRKLKLHSMCSQNKMFKHPKLKTMTQLSNKHSCRTQFFFSPQLLVFKYWKLLFELTCWIQTHRLNSFGSSDVFICYIIYSIGSFLRCSLSYKWYQRSRWCSTNMATCSRSFFLTGIEQA